MAQETKNEMAVTLPSDLEILVVRSFDAPRELVFEAWTSCEHMPKWMTGPAGWTMPICEVDFRPGGKFRWGWQKGEGGATMEIVGEFREVTPPERVVSTENWGDPWPETLNTIEFKEENGRTQVVLTMLFPSKAARDSALETGMNDGLSVSLDRLDVLLAKKGQG